MEVTLIPAIILAAVWLFSAWGKYGSTSETTTAIVQLAGISESWARRAAIVLPISEGLLAVGLVFPPTRETAAWASASLLTVFSVLVIRALLRGLHPTCNCFGALSHAKVGSGTVARNVVLLLIALFIASWGPFLQSFRLQLVPHGIAVLLVLMVLVLAGTAAMTWLVTNLIRQNGRLVMRVEALEAERHRNARDQEHGIDLSAKIRIIPSERDTRLVDLLPLTQSAVLIFLSEDCAPCRNIINVKLNTWIQIYGPATRLLVLIEKGMHGAAIAPGTTGLEAYFLEPGGLGAIGVPGTPCCVIMGSDGNITSGPHLGSEKIEAALESVT
jgi:hypothetical protein